MKKPSLLASVLVAAGLQACSVGSPPVVGPGLDAQAEAALHKSNLHIAATSAWRVQRPDGRQVVVIGTSMGGPPAAGDPAGATATTVPATVVAAAPVAPMPVAAAPSAPLASPPAAPRDVPDDRAAAMPEAGRALAETIEAWRLAWQAGDAAHYLRFYAPAFHGDAPDRAAWERQRRARLANGRIALRFEGLRTDLRANDADVRFVQHYASAKHRDAGEKRMRWAFRDGRWAIVEEHWAAR